MGMNSLYSVTGNRQFPGKRLSITNAEYSPEHLKHGRGQLHMVKAWRFPARIHSKDKPASSSDSSRCFVATNSFLVYSSSCSNNSLV